MEDDSGRPVTRRTTNSRYSRPRPTRTVATECRSRCKVTSGIPAAAHSWANQCPSPPVINRLPWLGSAENNHGPNWSLPDLALNAWTLACHKVGTGWPQRQAPRRSGLGRPNHLTGCGSLNSQDPPVQVPS
jgi:hypothetical protein